MNTDDLTNYGTVLSYAIENEDNELTFTDYGGFVCKLFRFINNRQYIRKLTWAGLVKPSTMPGEALTITIAYGTTIRP